MPQAYTINITMTPATVTVLSKNGFALYGFKAVKTTTQGAAPFALVPNPQCLSEHAGDMDGAVPRVLVD